MKTKQNDCEVLAVLQRATAPLSVKQVMGYTGISRSSAYNELKALVLDKKASCLYLGDNSYFFLKDRGFEQCCFAYQDNVLAPTLRGTSCPNTITINYYINE